MSIAFLGSLYSPLRGQTRAWHDATMALASAEWLVDVLDQQPAVADPDRPVSLRSVEGVFRLEQVTCRYPGQEQDALHGLSLNVPAGASVALVGASGAGKSTVARLLLRLVDQLNGAITLDGQDLRTMRLRDIRGAITILPQEPLYFTGSVREAIVYARPEASGAEIAAAAGGWRDGVR